jgi:hypothetical protein
MRWGTVRYTKKRPGLGTRGITRNLTPCSEHGVSQERVCAHQNTP